MGSWGIFSCFTAEEGSVWIVFGKGFFTHAYQLQSSQCCGALLLALTYWRKNSKNAYFLHWKITWRLTIFFSFLIVKIFLSNLITFVFNTCIYPYKNCSNIVITIYMLRLFLYILVSALIFFSFFFFFLNLILGAYFHSDNKITRKSILRIERYYKQIQANRLFHYAEVEFN